MMNRAPVDILRPRWNPAYFRRAQRGLALVTLALVAGAVVGRLIAGALFGGHPPALILLSVLPALGAMITLAGLAALTFWRPIARFLRRFAVVVFYAAVVGLVALVWVVALAIDRVDGLARAMPGGELTTDAIYHGLPAAIRFRVVSWLLWPLQFPIVRDLIALVGIVGFINLFAAYAIWWERKVAGRIQSRLGPMRVGGWHGWAQSPADGIKLLGKEDLIPAGADRVLFRLAPYLAFVPAVCGFVALPFGSGWVFRDLDVALVFVLALVDIEVLGVILGGWSSDNKWSLLGAMREACQLVAYEIPMGMALLVPVMMIGTLSLTRIGDAQQYGWHSWLAFQNPFAFVAMVAYFIASLASCKRAPFDLPEAESELVAGFMTEYSGFRWCVFFFAEYAAMFIVSALCVTLFLGAWYSPLPASWGTGLANGGLAARAIHGVLFSGPLWFVAKSLFLIFMQMWLRWTLPRIRIDQVLYACVQVLLPLTMLVVLGQTLWQLLVTPGSAVAVIANVLCSLAGAVLLGGFYVLMAHGLLHRRRLVGALAVDHLPGA